jgi:hypothetical protein
MSKLQVNDIVNKDDDGSVGFSRGAVITGVATATSFSGDLTGTASEASAAASGSALETAIDGKTSPGKAIALSMVFG